MTDYDACTYDDLHESRTERANARPDAPDCDPGLEHAAWVEAREGRTARMADEWARWFLETGATEMRER